MIHVCFSTERINGNYGYNCSWDSYIIYPPTVGRFHFCPRFSLTWFGTSKYQSTMAPSAASKAGEEKRIALGQLSDKQFIARSISCICASVCLHPVHLWWGFHPPEAPYASSSFFRQPSGFFHCAGASYNTASYSNWDDSALRLLQLWTVMQIELELFLWKAMYIDKAQ